MNKPSAPCFMGCVSPSLILYTRINLLCVSDSPLPTPGRPSTDILSVLGLLGGGPGPSYLFLGFPPETALDRRFCAVTPAANGITIIHVYGQFLYLIK